MNQPIIITSWNMGASIADFEMKNRELQELLPDSREIKRAELSAIYAKIDEIAAQHLFSRKCDAGNIVTLQENIPNVNEELVYVQFSSSEKRRFYRKAKRSATECAGIFDICKQLGIVDDGFFIKGRELLGRIVTMLIKMVQKAE